MLAAVGVVKPSIFSLHGVFSMTPTLNPFGNEEEGNEKKQNILFICAMLPGTGVEAMAG